MWNSYTGDICQYISLTQGLGDYRLSVPADFDAYLSSGLTYTYIPELDANVNDHWIRLGNRNTAVDGKAIIETGHAVFGSAKMLFPSAEFRDNDASGTLSLPSQFDRFSGDYWQGYVNYENGGGLFIMYDCFNVFGDYAPLPRNRGHSVRCVLQEDEE
jgi:hypothetical protein